VRISGRCASEFLKAGSHRDITGTRQAVGGGDIQNHPAGSMARKSSIFRGFSRSTCVYPGCSDVDFQVARRGGDQGAARRRSFFGAAAARQTGTGRLGLVVPATFGACNEVTLCTHVQTNTFCLDKVPWDHDFVTMNATMTRKTRWPGVAALCRGK
jgi:hypothetical protein